VAVEVRVQGYPCVGDGLVVCWGCWGKKSKALDGRKGLVRSNSFFSLMGVWGRGGKAPPECGE